MATLRRSEGTDRATRQEVKRRKTSATVTSLRHDAITAFRRFRGADKMDDRIPLSKVGEMVHHVHQRSNIGLFFDRCYLLLIAIERYAQLDSDRSGSRYLRIHESPTTFRTSKIIYIRPSESTATELTEFKPHT